MKSLIVYYSRYGNTARVADLLGDVLRKRGETNIAEIEYRDTKQNILKRTFFRFFPMFVRLAPIKSDLKDYDLLCMGVPVWGGKPSAPVTKYLLLAKGLVGKKALCFYIYSFKASAEICSEYT
jgi:multimeric flavodoxin WrbA